MGEKESGAGKKVRESEWAKTEWVREIKEG